VRGDATAMRTSNAATPRSRCSGARAQHQCKGRVDWLTKHYGMMTRSWAEDVARLPRLHVRHPGREARVSGLQWAWYYDGFRAITGRDAKVVEIVVESAPPYAVATYVITTDIIEQARAQYEELLELRGEVRGREPLARPGAGRAAVEDAAVVERAEGDDGDLSTELGLEL
jgi:hypothetical protein